MNKVDTVELFSALVPLSQFFHGAGASFLADGGKHDVTNVLTKFKPTTVGRNKRGNVCLLVGMSSPSLVQG